MEKQRKKLVLMSMVLLAGTSVFAQGNGVGINEATQMVLPISIRRPN